MIALSDLWGTGSLVPSDRRVKSEIISLGRERWRRARTGADRFVAFSLYAQEVAKNAPTDIVQSDPTTLFDWYWRKMTELKETPPS
jgi:hypothetical protein